MFAPVTFEKAHAYRALHRGGLIVSGGTETGLSRNRRGIGPAHVLSVSRISELSDIKQTDLLSVGASVNCTDLQEFAPTPFP